jgi:hypothetical protein
MLMGDAHWPALARRVCELLTAIIHRPYDPLIELNPTFGKIALYLTGFMEPPAGIEPATC